MDTILNGCATLSERLSQIDDGLVREHLKETQNNVEKSSEEVEKNNPSA